MIGMPLMNEQSPISQLMQSALHSSLLQLKEGSITATQDNHGTGR